MPRSERPAGCPRLGGDPNPKPCSEESGDQAWPVDRRGQGPHVPPVSPTAPQKPTQQRSSGHSGTSKDLLFLLGWKLRLHPQELLLL